MASFAALPDEIILQILSFLHINDLVRCQSLSLRFLDLCRDSNIWKTECFDHSRAEAQRRRQQLMNARQDAELVALREAVSGLPRNGSNPTNQQSTQLPDSAKRKRVRALANWDPAYPDERVDYYQEYIHRHAPIATSWLHLPRDKAREGKATHEATGVGLLCEDGGAARHVVAPMDDGSICIWDVSARTTGQTEKQGNLVGRSVVGLLSDRSAEADRAKAVTESRRIMTETGAVECVSIDSTRKRAYFAVQDVLHEVDLQTLETVSRQPFPFPITALSNTHDGHPVTVGTTWTLHVHDPRAKPNLPATDSPVQCEHIGGPSPSHATLSQPGPLSILHHPGFSVDDHSIWVAGRFTHLLNYDRRFFPRLRGTIHSGARISCIAALPHPYVPRSLDLLQDLTLSLSDRTAAKTRPGTTILAAGTYKGKGALELYGLDGAPFNPNPNPNSNSSLRTPSISLSGTYQNRQTASASKLLSVASHGAALVFSDGDGNLKWVERDGFSAVRTHNINESNEPLSFNQAQTQAQAQDASAYGIFSSTAAEMPGQGDIVQKIVAMGVSVSCTGEAEAEMGWSGSGNGRGRWDVNQNDLLLWTGDGRLGVLGFGHECWYQREEVEERARSAEEMAREDAERQNAGAMRRALQMQADEVRVLRGLGMGFGIPY